MFSTLARQEHKLHGMCHGIKIYLPEVNHVPAHLELSGKEMRCDTFRSV